MKMKIKHVDTLSVAALFIISCFLPGQCLSEDIKQAALLDEIVVTATKVEEPKKDISVSVQVITQEDIKDSTAKDAGDLIAEASVGHVHKYNGELTSMIQIRGLSTDNFNAQNSRVLVLMDGSNVGTVNLAKIPVDDIERIEIVKGPASVLYGSAAMGGVINIITKESKDGFHGALGGEAGALGYWQSSGELSGKEGLFDYYLTVGHSEGDDYRAKGYGKIENTAFKNESTSARIGYKIFDDQHISLGFQHWNGWDIGTPGPAYNPDPDNYSNKERNGFDLEYKTQTLNAKYYFVGDKDESHGGMTSGLGNSALYTTRTDTQGSSLQKSFLFGEYRIIIGGQWDRIEVASLSNTGSPYYPDSQYDDYGAFTEGRLSLLEKKLLVSMGLRYDYFKDEILATPGIESLIPKTEHLNHVTQRAGVVYKLTDAIDFKSNIGTAFRTPSPLELASDYVAWGTHYLGNPDLKPEKSMTYDAGVDYSKGVLQGGLAFFHTDFKDKIVSYYDTPLAASTYKNSDGATIEGIEMNAAYDLGPYLGVNSFIKPFTNVTYNIKYVDESQSPTTNLLYTPKWTGALGIKAGQEIWDAQFIANYTGKEEVTDWDSSSSTYGKTIGKGHFTVCAVKGTYWPLKNLELTVSVENLFDKEYEYVDGYPMAGRTLTGGAKWIF